MVASYVVRQDIIDAFPDDTTEFATPDITLIDELIVRASRYLDRESWRLPGAYAVSTDSVLLIDGPKFSSFDPTRLWIPEIAQAPTLVEYSTDGGQTNFTTLVSTGYFLWPQTYALMQKPYMRLDLNTVNGVLQAWPSAPKSVRLTAHFGYSLTVPDDAKQAVIFQIGRWFRRAKQRYQNLSIQTDPNQAVYKEFDPEFTETCRQLRQGNLGYLQ